MLQIQNDRSDEAQAKIQMIKYLKESLETTSKLTFDTPEDVAIFIGTTKSGKSTLLNSLLGNKLIGQKDPTLRSTCVLKADNNLGPEIGRGPTSETIYPSRWISSEKLGELVLWDSPGFEDNRGPIQDIINAFYVHRLFNNINSAKIVLVTDVNDILHDCINPFISLLNSLENLFENVLNNCFSNIIIAFTKVPATLEDEPVDVPFISDVLDHQLLSSDTINMSQTTKNFVRHLTTNHNQICLFKKANVGPIPSNADAQIVRSIQSINGIQRNILKTVKPSIADASKLFLFHARDELVSKNSLIELQTSVVDVFEKKLDEYNRKIEGEQSEEILSAVNRYLISFKNELQTIIDADVSFHMKINLLLKMNEFNELLADDLIEKSKMMEFIDNVLGLVESQILNVSLRSMLETTKSKINETIIEVQQNLHKMSKQEAAEKIKKIREEQKENEEINKKEREKLEKENKETEDGFFTWIGRTLDQAMSYIINNILRT